MKKKILDDIKIDIAKSVLEELEIQKICKKMLPKIKEYFSQALDEYGAEKYKKGYADGKNNQPYGINL